jgi:hypothetical protein
VLRLRKPFIEFELACGFSWGCGPFSCMEIVAKVVMYHCTTGPRVLAFMREGRFLYLCGRNTCAKTREARKNNSSLGACECSSQSEKFGPRRRGLSD